MVGNSIAGGRGGDELQIILAKKISSHYELILYFVVHTSFFGRSVGRLCFFILFFSSAVPNSSLHKEEGPRNENTIGDSLSPFFSRLLKEKAASPYRYFILFFFLPSKD